MFNTALHVRKRKFSSNATHAFITYELQQAALIEADNQTVKLMRFTVKVVGAMNVYQAGKSAREAVHEYRKGSQIVNSKCKTVSYRKHTVIVEALCSTK